MERPEELLKSWMRLCTDPRTSSDLLEKAAYWESINRPKEYKIRLAVAKHRSASSEILAKLSMVKNLAVQIAVAAHANLSEASAAKLLKLQVRELRRSLAGNPNIPIFVMNKLVKDFDDVRMRLAKNPSLPPALQKKLVGEKSVNIRKSLCANRRLHPAILERLGHDKEVEVRVIIVEHPDMPRAGLKEMANDPSSDVREAVYNRAMVDFSEEASIFENLTKHKDAIAGDAQDHLAYLENKSQGGGWDQEPE